MTCKRIFHNTSKSMQNHRSLRKSSRFTSKKLAVFLEKTRGFLRNKPPNRRKKRSRLRQISPNAHAVFAPSARSSHAMFTQFSPSVHAIFIQFSCKFHAGFAQFSRSFHAVFPPHCVRSAQRAPTSPYRDP